MADYGRVVQFGVFITPRSDRLDNGLALAALADESLDFIGVQDHPYQRRFLDAWAFMSNLLLRTERVRVVPDVANVPLREPAVMAKMAASLDVLSGGRMELALGAGAFWDPIVAMGGPRRSPRQAAQALREAVEVTRLMWSGERAVSYDGEFYRLKGLHPGPQPVHDMQVWLGVGGPKLLRYLGGHADGWIPSNSYFPPDVLPQMQRQIDAGALEAGRDPAEIARVYNVFGRIVDVPTDERFNGTVEQWVETLVGLVVETGMDTFIFAAPDDDVDQVRRFAREVVPAVRDGVDRRRR
ncbi:LLM class flavin-dependent oxidoreductase [Mycolicibacterium palauense]|uniref:LLM class flavin-dependent oxidoreductase n=1 Tax=Mycolicibacterium palauense TaxID=2034511 RepID=UPI000BFEEC7F|nr:LLM class flavin-dependent oxidoreductase [Mycolicibacterium palauense]